MEWIKLWTKETIYGTTSKEIPYNMRGIWFQLLAMAGLEPYYGKVCINKNIGYVNNQLALILDVPLDILKKGLKILQEVDKIKINSNGVIDIVNWEHYQSQAGYMKSYREGHKKSMKGAKKSKNVRGKLPLT